MNHINNIREFRRGCGDINYLNVKCTEESLCDYCLGWIEGCLGTLKENIIETTSMENWKNVKDLMKDTEWKVGFDNACKEFKRISEDAIKEVE